MDKSDLLLAPNYHNTIFVRNPNAVQYYGYPSTYLNVTRSTRFCQWNDPIRCGTLLHHQLCQLYWFFFVVLIEFRCSSDSNTNCNCEFWTVVFYNSAFVFFYCSPDGARTLRKWTVTCNCILMEFSLCCFLFKLEEFWDYFVKMEPLSRSVLGYVNEMTVIREFK